MVDVRESTIKGAGRGVFTNRAFKEDELVCTYGYVRCDTGEASFTDEELAYLLRDNDSGMWYIGRKEPDPLEPDAVAQFINDGASLTKSIDDQRRIGAYMRESSAKRNVYNDGTEFYALHDIPENTELFFTYGYEYWLGYENQLLNFLLGSKIDDELMLDDSVTDSSKEEAKLIAKCEMAAYTNVSNEYLK